MLAIFRFASRTRLLAAYFVAGVVAGAVSFAFGQSQNFDVFSAAARALLRGDDVYVRHAADDFKYAPTFALLFVPFTWMPSWIAAIAWSTLNFGVAAIGIDRALDDDRDKRIALAIALAGIALATDGDQSNLLVGGAWLLAFRAFEDSRPRVGAGWITFGAFVKLFPAIGAAFALLGPRRARALVALGVATLAWAALPLVVCTPRTLALEYASWARLVSLDHANRGWSMLPVFREQLHFSWANVSLQIAGALVQSAPIVLGTRFGTDRAWRRTLACSLLVFAVLFNHRSEYASFVLSAIALGVWCATTRPGRIARVLVAFALVAPGPFFARSDPHLGGAFAFLAAHRMFHPLRVLPLFAVWLLMQRELWARFVRVELALPARLREEHSR
jgi:hypothetical protein